LPIDSSGALFSANNFNVGVGQQGEHYVADWLLTKGFKLYAQNYRIRGGEIDIIAGKENLIVFVEVKTRLNDYFALSEVITQQKQRIIIRTAKQYLREHKMHVDTIIRFDVALVHAGKPLNYIADAFRQTEE
jgi:putative endonuclease